MLARRRTPFQELVGLQRDLMSLFHRSFDGPTAEATGFWTPTEAYFKDGHLVVRMELAGVEPKSVDVSVADRTLTIKGERKAPEIPLDDRIFGEIAYGKFERTVMLPEGVNADGITAVWHNGILEVTIPMSQALPPKKVPVEIAEA